MEKLLKALANRKRLAITRLLHSRGAMTVGDIADELQAPLKTASKHLLILRAAGIVEREQTGYAATYFMDKPIHSCTKVILQDLTS